MMMRSDTVVVTNAKVEEKQKIEKNKEEQVRR